MREPCSGYQPIADYALIGDCHSAALISRHGSIDWYCPERFDAPSLFAALLDVRNGGRFRIAPVDQGTVERRYLPETNLLETTHRTETGSIRVIDFMPVHRRSTSHRGHDVGSSRRILRLVEGLAGSVTIEIAFDPRFDYARTAPRLSVRDGVGVASAGGRFASLGLAERTLDFHDAEAGGYEAVLQVEAGARHWLVLTDCDDPDRAIELPSSRQCDEQLNRSKGYWEAWSRRCTYQGPYRDAVLRSALTLKLLTYEPTGAIVAAPTASLPEQIGGERNWDYRFAWTRDSSMILSSLMSVGYVDEAADFFEWLQGVHQSDSTTDVQVLYGIDGRRDVEEIVIDGLAGYRCSTPVRVGNGAVRQIQHDIYGEVVSAAHVYFGAGIGHRSGPPQNADTRERWLSEDWPLLSGLVERASAQWSVPDNGIWEVRGGAKAFLYSRLMCWVALDLGVRMGTRPGLRAPLARWKKTRSEIQRAILEDGFDPDVGAFVQAVGVPALDATALLIPRVGLLPASDPRMTSTIDRLRSHLTKDGLVFRYRSSDGLTGTEATFATCTFWLADALALAGRLDEARDVFERVSGYTNDVGLLAEEIDPEHREMLGNFPQGFSHMALINTAMTLAKIEKHGPERRTETVLERTLKAADAAK